MLNSVNLKDVVVFDIETVSGQKKYSALTEPMQKLWDIKSKQPTLVFLLPSIIIMAKP